MNFEKVNIDTVSQDPKNKRLRTDENYMALRESLRRFDQQIPIVVQKDGVIVKGNGTWLAAKELGWKEIWVHRTGLEGVEAELFSIADNRIAELSEWDYEQLSIAMQQTDGMAEQLITLGWTEQLLAPLRIAEWKADDIEKLEPPPKDKFLEPSVFLDFDGDDMAHIAAGVSRWREMHPGSAQAEDAKCVAKICAWYSKQKAENS